MRQLSTLVILILCLASCRDKVVCPAFQSAYILDDSVRSTYFSYLWKLDENTRNNYLTTKGKNQNQANFIANTDTSTIASSPNESVVLASASTSQIDYFDYVKPYIVEPREVNKSKNGIIKSESFWLKNYRLRTSPMENVLTPSTPDEDVVFEEEGEILASDYTDSVTMLHTFGMDSATLGNVVEQVEEDTSDFEIPKLAQVVPETPKTKLVYLYRFDPEDKALNVEQAYYIKHFGQYLYTRVQANPDTNSSNESTDTTSTKRRRLFGKGEKKKKEKASKNLVDEDIVNNDPSTEPIDEEPNETIPAAPVNVTPTEPSSVDEEDPSGGF